MQAKSSSLQWNSKRKYELLCGSSTGEFVFLSFKYDFHVGTYEAIISNKATQYTALASVIDGSVVSCTPLSKYCTPPPMAHFKVNFSGQVIDLCFASNVICGLIMASEGYKIEAYRYEWDAGTEGDLMAAFDLEDGTKYPRLPHIQVAQDQEIKTIFAGETGKETKLYEIRCSGSNKNSTSCYPQEHGVALNWIKTSESSFSAHYFGFNNELVYSQDSVEIVQLPAPAQSIAKILNFPGKGGVMHLAFLTEGSQLFIDTELIAENCTSFAHHGDFFLFTMMTQNMFDMLFLYPVKDLAKAKTAVCLLLIDRSLDSSNHQLAKITQSEM